MSGMRWSRGVGVPGSIQETQSRIPGANVWPGVNIWPGGFGDGVEGISEDSSQRETDTLCDDLKEEGLKPSKTTPSHPSDGRRSGWGTQFVKGVLGSILHSICE